MERTNTIKDFFDQQLRLWPEARTRYEALKNVKTRQVGQLLLQHNPPRIVSTGADIKKAVSGKRPCFLCSSNRPKEQFAVDLGCAEILVNPYPILHKHYTIPLKLHKPQEISLFEECISAIFDLDSSLMIFYNGPHCGASAPDHAHLQAGTSGLLPIQRLWNNDVEWLKEYNGAQVGLVKTYACPVIAVKGKPRIETLPFIGNDVNIITWLEQGEQIALLFPRSKHRPACYDHGTLVSPGALDMGGLIITPQEKDFNELDEKAVTDILKEVSMTETEVRNIINKIR